MASCLELCLFEVVYDKWFCLSKGVPALFAATEEMPFLLGSARFRAGIFFFQQELEVPQRCFLSPHAHLYAEFLENTALLMSCYTLRTAPCVSNMGSGSVYSALLSK